jgi:hypothetical protein
VNTHAEDLSGRKMSLNAGSADLHEPPKDLNGRVIHSHAAGVDSNVRAMNLNREAMVL